MLKAARIATNHIRHLDRLTKLLQLLEFILEQIFRESRVIRTLEDHISVIN